MGVLDLRRWVFRARSPEEQVHLATRIMRNEHEGDVAERTKSTLGERATLIKHYDLSHNLLSGDVSKKNRALQPSAPYVSSLTADLARVLDDESAVPTVEEYEAAGGRPLPTTAIHACEEAQGYRLGVGYAGIRIDLCDRRKRITLEVILPRDLEPTYSSDDPLEPTRVRFRASREIDGKSVDVIEEYDISDPGAPSYRVWHQGLDVTARINDGRSYTGEGYLWRDEGVPFIPVVVTGNPRDPFRTLPLVEATLQVAVRWSAWGVGCDHASHPQRHVRGLYLAGVDSDMDGGDNGGSGVAVGPETVLVWADDDPERPGTHWQDAPAFDPETTARAIRSYATSASNALTLAVDFEGTGGEPTARELEQREADVQATYPLARRMVRELIRRCAAYARILEAAGILPPGEYGGSEYGVAFRGEIAKIVKTEPEPAKKPEQDDDEEEIDDGG